MESLFLFVYSCRRFMAHILNRTVLVHDLVPHNNYPNQTLRDPNIIWDMADISFGVPALREVRSDSEYVHCICVLIFHLQSEVNLEELLGRKPTEYALPWSFRYNVITDRLEEPGTYEFDQS